MVSFTNWSLLKVIKTLAIISFQLKLFDFKVDIYLWWGPKISYQLLLLMTQVLYTSQILESKGYHQCSQLVQKLDEFIASHICLYSLLFFVLCVLWVQVKGTVCFHFRNLSTKWIDFGEVSVPLVFCHRNQGQVRKSGLKSPQKNSPGRELELFWWIVELKIHNAEHFSLVSQ